MINQEKVGQEQIHELLFEEKLSWQAIIYDLINTEQLDPWNIDISLLAQKYLEKIRLLEEANFFISSKVLLAASLLLRIKSEIVLNQDIPTLDDILFGKDEEKASVQERIELDEDIPGLVPRTPLPRFRRVTLEELMSALGKAIKTETRRIKKEIIVRQQEREINIALPKSTVNLQEKIRDLYSKLEEIFSSRDSKLAFSELIHKDTREERVAVFVSLLHLDNQQKIWLEQESHFEEIWILIKGLYESQNRERLSALRAEVEEFMRNAEKEQDASDVSMNEPHLEDDGEDEENVIKFSDRRDVKDSDDEL